MVWLLRAKAMVSKLPTSLSLMVATFHYRRGKVSQLHCLGREKEIGLEKGVMNTAYSAFEKWPLAYLRNIIKYYYWKPDYHKMIKIVYR